MDATMREENKRTVSRARKGEVARYILGTIGVVGLVAVGLTMPGVLRIAPFFLRSTRNKYKKTSVARSLSTLHQRGLVQFTRTARGYRVELTAQGLKKFQSYEFEGKLARRKPRRWDKKWWILIFDIEEKRRSVRNAVRGTLKQFGFYHLQDSVWVYPYECKDALELLRTYHVVRHDAIIMRVDSISNDKELRRHFGLKC